MATQITSEMHKEAQAKLTALIEQSGVKPLTIERLQAMGTVWPEHESVDDFLEVRKRLNEEVPERKIVII